MTGEPVRPPFEVKVQHNPSSQLHMSSVSVTVNGDHLFTFFGRRSVQDARDLAHNLKLVLKEVFNLTEQAKGGWEK